MVNEETIRQNAREKMRGFCRVCKICDGKNCTSGVPGMGGVGIGFTFMANNDALARVKLRMRSIHDVVDPDTSTEFLGLSLDFPVMIAPMAGTDANMGSGLSEEEFTRNLLEGSIAAGTTSSTGAGLTQETYEMGLKAIKSVSGRGFPVIKPWIGDKIIEMIRMAEEIGAAAVGVDVDGVNLVNRYAGKIVGEPKTPAKIAELAESTDLPLIIKGIMTPEEAEACYEAGAKAVVVSNHGGRVIDGVPGAAEVLQQIAAKVKGKIKILADGGVRSGFDVLKMLALGADAVLVGRPLIIANYGGGKEGVAFTLNQYREQLKQAMVLTGCTSIAAAGLDIIYYE